MAPSIDVALFRLMAINAADAELGVARAFPILNQRRRVGLVTLDATRVGGSDHGF